MILDSVASSKFLSERKSLELMKKLKKLVNVHDKYKERCEKRNVWVQGKRQEILAEHQRRVMMDKEKSRQAMHKTVRNLVISIVAIVLCYILLDKILPIAVDRASDSLSHSLDHFTDRLFGH